MMNKLYFPHILSVALMISCGQKHEDQTPSEDAQWEDIYSSLELNEEESTMPSDMEGTPENEGKPRLSGDNFEALKVIRSDLRAQRHEVCGIDSSVTGDVRESIRAIREDESLTNEEKKTQARTLIEENKELFQAQKEAFQVCREDNADALQVIRDEEKALAEVCFGGKNFRKDPAHKKGKKGGMKGLRGKSFSGGKSDRSEKRAEKRAEMIADIQAQVDSEECTAAIQDHQAKSVTQ